MKKISNFLIKYADALVCWTAGFGAVINAAADDFPMAIVWSVISTAWFIISINNKDR